MKTVDAEVKVKTMHGIYMFRRDRTSQVIECNPWSTILHPYPSLVKKMGTYLGLEGDLVPSPKPNLRPSCNQPNCNKSIHNRTNKDQPNQAPTPESGNPKHLKLMTKEERQ